MLTSTINYLSLNFAIQSCQNGVMAFLFYIDKINKTKNNEKAK